MSWAPNYLTDEEASDYLSLSDPPGISDEEAATLPGFVTAASRAIDRACNRQFGLVAEAEERLYVPYWDHYRARWIVQIDDLMSTSGLAARVLQEDGTEVGEATYTLEPKNAAAEGKPWTTMVLLPASPARPCDPSDVLGIAGPWGWTEFPDTIVTACKLQLARFWARRQSPYGIAGSPDQGSELRLLAKVDPDVAVMLTNYVRLRAVG